jgi:hypothetical protein
MPNRQLLCCCLLFVEGDRLNGKTQGVMPTVGKPLDVLQEMKIRLFAA